METARRAKSDDLISPAEAAVIAGVSPETVRRLCRAGDVPGARQDPLNGRWSLPSAWAERRHADAVRRYAARQRAFHAWLRNPSLSIRRIARQTGVPAATVWRVIFGPRRFSLSELDNGFASGESATGSTRGSVARRADPYPPVGG